VNKACRYFEFREDIGEWCKLKQCTCLECLDTKSLYYVEKCPDRENEMDNSLPRMFHLMLQYNTLNPIIFARATGYVKPTLDEWLEAHNQLSPKSLYYVEKCPDRKE